LADDLEHPERHAVADAEVPRAIDIGSLVHRDATNALVPLRLHNLASVEGTDDGGLEAALVFLRILLFSEHLARTGQFLFVKDARFRRLEHEMHPIWINDPSSRRPRW